MKKFHKTSLATVIGAAVVSGFTANVNAETNPFAMAELANGYMQTAANNTTAPAAPAAQTAPATPAHDMATHHTEAKTGGTCAEGKCGAMMKDKEGSGGEMKHAPAAAAASAKTEEGKCGEGMCGSMMESGHMKPGMEMSCGAMMKGKEGSCGNMAAPAATTEHAESAKAHEGMMQDGHMKSGMDMKSGMEMSCGAMMKGKEGSCGEMVHKPAAETAAPAAVHAPVAAPAPAAVAKPATPAPAVAKPAQAAPAKPAAAPVRETANKVVEGQCAAVKEETHEASKHHEIENKANAPWGNRKKVVNP